MKAKPTKQHIDQTVAHIMATLPDSIRLRKTVLVTMLYLLPRDCAARVDVKMLAESLATHEAAQLKLGLPLDGQ